MNVVKKSEDFQSSETPHVQPGRVYIFRTAMVSCDLCSKCVARVSSAGIALAKGNKQLKRQIAQIMIMQPRNHDTTAQNEWGARNS